MNKREVIAKVALEARVNEEDCIKVIDTLEEVLSEEKSNGSWNRTFENVYSIMTRIRNRKQKRAEK